MIPYEKKTIDTHLLVEQMEVRMFGNSLDGSRTISVSIPVADVDGKWIENKYIEVTGEQFNTLFNMYTTDKAFITAVFQIAGVTADLSSMPDDMLNQPEENTNVTNGN